MSLEEFRRIVSGDGAKAVELRRGLERAALYLKAFATAYQKALKSPESRAMAQKIKSQWEAETGRPYLPVNAETLDEWISLSREAGISADDLLHGDFQLAEFYPIIRGYLRSLRNQKNGPSRSAERTGRPRKNEKDGDTKVVAALAAHHKYDPDGSIGNYEPATVTGLARENNPDLSKAAISRFLARKFENGHKGYVVACTQRRIGMLLALWQGEAPSHLASLRLDE